MAQEQKKPSENVYIVLAAALVVCMISSIFMMPFVPDDSYISFRYAENLAKGAQGADGSISARRGHRRKQEGVLTCPTASKNSTHSARR